MKDYPLTRRNLLKASAAGVVLAAAGNSLYSAWSRIEPQSYVFIGSAKDYGVNLRDIVLRGLTELEIRTDQIKDKNILLKPNLVEPHKGLSHINTHPLLIQAVAEAFLSLGASQIRVAEGAGHRRDAFIILEESGLADVLYEDKIPFSDLNNSDVVKTKNKGRLSKLGDLYLPRELFEADLVVSLAKMKTHHWVGATLSMKNLFGIMPGIVYGWPKNVLHHAGINRVIYDINASFPPHLAIVDGITGMEGDGPIMGSPVESKVLVIGENAPSVDATCARIMGIDPLKLTYLQYASGRIGAIKEKNISQIGERIDSVRSNFQLLDKIPAHSKIRLL